MSNENQNTHTADIAAAALQEAGNRIGDQIDCARASAKKLQGTAKDYIAQKPIQALAVTLGVGLLLGLAFGRR